MAENGCEPFPSTPPPPLPPSPSNPTATTDSGSGHGGGSGREEGREGGRKAPFWSCGAGGRTEPVRAPPPPPRAHGRAFLQLSPLEPTKPLRTGRKEGKTDEAALRGARTAVLRFGNFLAPIRPPSEEGKIIHVEHFSEVWRWAARLPLKVWSIKQEKARPRSSLPACQETEESPHLSPLRRQALYLARHSSHEREGGRSARKPERASQPSARAPGARLMTRKRGIT